MNGGPTDSWTRTTGFHDAAESVSARVLARVSTTPTHILFRSSSGHLPPLRDGTDPLLGGLRAAAPGDSQTVVGSGPRSRS